MIIRYDAERLAKMFLDETEIPAEYKNKNKNKIVPVPKEKETKIMLNFIEHLNGWQTTINIMLEKLTRAKAFRFIHLSPEIGESITRIVDCDDFIDFAEYLILRRDIENCYDDELGRLCMLSVAFQQIIESSIKLKETRALKNLSAKSLIEQNTTTIERIELNLWEDHPKETVS